MIVLFDGVCNLCHGSVRFILGRERAQRFEFASLQSRAAQGLLAARGRGELAASSLASPSGSDESAQRDALDGEAGGRSTRPGSLVLIDGERVWTRSSAALRIAKTLRWPWPLLAVFLIVPAFLRDLPYRLIASLRYRLFGRMEFCKLPSGGDPERFLDRDEWKR